MMNKTKEDILLEMLNKEGLDKETYNKLLSDEDFSAVDALELQDEYRAINRCEKGIKAGNLETYEAAWERIEAATFKIGEKS